MGSRPARAAADRPDQPGRPRRMGPMTRRRRMTAPLTWCDHCGYLVDAVPERPDWLACTHCGLLHHEDDPDSQEAPHDPVQPVAEPERPRRSRVW